MAIRSNQRGEEVAAAIKAVLDKDGGPTRKAPISAHRMLDALMATEDDPKRGAPEWAHDVLDFIWDLLF